MNTSINQTILDTVLNSTYMMEMNTDFVELKGRQTITIEKYNDDYNISLHELPKNRNFKKAKLLSQIKVKTDADILNSINNMLMDYNGGVVADGLNITLLMEYYSDIAVSEWVVGSTVKDILKDEMRCDWFDGEIANELVSMYLEPVVDDERYHLPS